MKHCEVCNKPMSGNHCVACEPHPTLDESHIRSSVKPIAQDANESNQEEASEALEVDPDASEGFDDDGDVEYDA